MEEEEEEEEEESEEKCRWDRVDSAWLGAGALYLLLARNPAAWTVAARRRSCARASGAIAPRISFG